MAALSPYTTALALKRPAPSHVLPGVYNADRIQAYATYEDMWNNVPEAFATLLRNGDDPKSRRYVPLIRSLIEATNRYLAVDFDTAWTTIPGASDPSDDQMKEFLGRLGSLWAREEVEVKFLSNKRWAMIKGDGLLHITADPAKAEGTRIRLTEIEPDQYFPILDPSDNERVLGVYLASIVADDADNDIVQRIEYRRIFTEEQSAAANGTPIGSIFYRVGYFELNGWDDREPDGELKPVPAPIWAVPADPAAADLAAGVALPTQITTIPVYHIRNRRRGGPTGVFGLSEVQGLETLLAGVIQNTTDEDTAVAQQGLGVYWTDSGKPRDAKGNETEWEIGPASVAELEKDGKFGRVDGITSVSPMQDHIGYLSKAGREASAIAEVAAGGIDTAAAASGVALKIQFMPTLANTAEKERELASKWTQLLFDLTQMWFPAYEGWQPLPLQPSVHFGDPLPIDRTATLAEVIQMVAAGLASKEWAVGYLKEKLGYNFPDGMLAQATAEQQATLDAMGARIDEAAAGAPSVPVPAEGA
jgi:hypothetical protein